MTLLKRGDRVRITAPLPGEPDPEILPVGAQGTVSNVMNQSTSIEQICVDWDDNPTQLMLLPTDSFEVIPPKRATRRTATKE